MGLWRWVTKRMNVQDLDSWRWFYGRDADSGEPVTPETAMKLSAWWSCTRLIAETIATLPCGVYQKDAKGDPQALPEHFLSGLLRDRPNDWQTPVEWWEGRVAPLCSDGNSYAEKMMIGDRLVALDPLKVENCAPFRDQQDGWRLKYKITDRGKTYTLTADKVFHIRGFGQDEIVGLSPVANASRSLGAALAADRAAASMYGKGLRAPGFWTPPVDMTKEQREQFVKNYVAPAEGSTNESSGRVVMPPGFEWKNFSITPKDAELLMSRGFSVEDVCRWMGVPPILIGHSSQGQTMWGSGVEQIILGWLVLGLRAYLKRIEAAVNARLMPIADRGKGIYFEFNFEGLLRADSAGRAALMSTLAQNGLRTRNELRKLDNMPGLPGGDDLTVQSNLVPVGKLGEQQQTAQVVRNSLRNWLLEERENERKAA
jgi:HK97 family phage portal protein